MLKYIAKRFVMMLITIVHHHHSYFFPHAGNPGRSVLF